MILPPRSHPRGSVSKPSSGLVIPMRATVSGRVRWQTLDERGVPEVPRSPSGFALATPEGVGQPNLITNYGLNQIASRDVFEVRPGVTGGWRRRLSVGTGSTAPAVTDTALANFAQADSTSGAFPNGSVTYELDGTANVWRATVVVTRLVTMTADRNLTEFGLNEEAALSLHIRELLRDGVGDPVTVSLLLGKSIRVDHTLTIEIPAPVAGNAISLDIEEYDVGNNLVATTPFSVVHGGHVMSLTTANLAEVFKAWSPPNIAPLSARRRITGSVTYARTAAYTSTSIVDPATNAIAPFVTVEPYVPDSFERIKRHTSAAGEMNTAWHGFAFVNNINQLNNELNRSGWFVQFVSPASYTKADTDTLRVGTVSSWARA